MGGIADRGKRAAWAAVAEADFCAWVASLEGAEVVDTPHLLRVRTTMPHAYLNPVICRHLPVGGALDSLIAETRAYYAAHGGPCAWFVTPQTTPADIGETLVAHGMVRREGLPVMAIDLSALPEAVAIPADCTIDEVRGGADWADWGRTFAAGYGMPAAIADPTIAALATLPSGPGTVLHHYLARLGGAPVAIAMLFTGGGAAGIQAVATVPEARERGIGAAVTLAALRAGRAQGMRVGVLEATEMGRPVYRRLGFVDCCVWEG
jgi:GNAT superfamily N-acetyltransferase